MQWLDNLAESLSRWLRWVGGVAVVAMMTVTCIDVVLRRLGAPITGAVEIEAWLGTLTLACALPQTQLRRGHPGVGLLVRRLGHRSGAAMRLAAYLAALLVCGLIAWQCWVYADELLNNSEVSMTLEFPVHWVARVLALCFGGSCVVLVKQAWHAGRKAAGNE